MTMQVARLLDRIRARSAVKSASFGAPSEWHLSSAISDAGRLNRARRSAARYRVLALQAGPTGKPPARPESYADAALLAVLPASAEPVTPRPLACEPKRRNKCWIGWRRGASGLPPKRYASRVKSGTQLAPRQISAALPE